MTGPKTSFCTISSSCLEARDDGRGVEVALLADLVAARLDLGVGGETLDEPDDLLELVRVVERAVHDVLVVRLAGLDLGRGLRERAHELVVDRLVDQHASGRGAVLAGVEVARLRDALDGLGDVGVLEDDDRRLAAQLQVDALEVLRRRLGDRHAGPHRAGDGGHRRGLVLDHQTAGVAVAADDVEDALGHDRADDVGHQDRGRRGGVRRLPGRPCCRGERRGELPRPSSSGSSTARPARRRRSARGGSWRSGPPCTHPALRPPASAPRPRRSGSGRPSAGSPRSGSARWACPCSPPRPRSVPRPAPRTRPRSSAGPSAARPGPGSRQAGKARRRPPWRRPRPPARTGRSVGLARGGVDHLGGPSVGGVPELTVDVVAQTTQLGAHCRPSSSVSTSGLPVSGPHIC